MDSRCLIAIWSEGCTQRKLDESYRNRRIYEEISKRTEEKGHRRSWLQCQRKIKHLKLLYRKTKDSNCKSGRDKATCPFYKELDMVLGDRPPFSPGVGHVIVTKVEDTRDEESPSSSLLAETQDDDLDCDGECQVSDRA